MPPITTNACSSAAVGAHEARPADVDRVHVAVERRGDHRGRVGQRQVEVPGEQVAGAARHDRERHAEPAIAWLTARTVPSPPATSTTVAPASSASRVTPSPRSSTVVS
jgi:hypothetical protein